MKLKQVPARRGITWVRQGFAVFGQRPLGFTGLFTTVLFAFVLSGIIPAGGFLVLACMPLVTVAFMIATQTALQGRFPMPTVFIEPFRRGRQQTMAIVTLGLLYAAAVWLVMALGDMVDGGKLEQVRALMMAGQQEEIQRVAQDPQLQNGLLFRIALISLLSVPFWHAPTLVHWGGYGATKSLFFSTVACWHNKGAFLLFGVAWSVVSMVMTMGAMLVAILLGVAGAASVVAMPLTLVLGTVFYASLFFTFADSFSASGNEPPVAPAAAAEPQAVESSERTEEKGPE